MLPPPRCIGHRERRSGSLDRAGRQLGIRTRVPRLAAERRLIGGNDLWVAAVALANGVPAVTRNTRHYRRVPGLDVKGYSACG